MTNRLVVAFVSILALVFLFADITYSGIYDFKGGVRIPTGSCTIYSNTPKAQFVSSSGGIAVYNYDGSIDVTCVCQLPVPENARIRQFVIVGNVTKGKIIAELGGLRWNAPRQHLQYASAMMNPNTPYEVPQMKQKK